MNFECTLSDAELIKSVQDILIKLLANPPQHWALRVPPDKNTDPDFVISEMIDRFKYYSEKSLPNT